ncbi:MAG: site-specific integrase, partial [Deltaproteobacteria bacterium]|nr:site-specific integrase [Deltaproteobacteria bacterium]
MESHPEKPLVESFIESLVTERGYSDHTCRAYHKDLNDFFAFAADY